MELAQVLLQGGDLFLRAGLGVLGALKAGGCPLLLLLEPLDAGLILGALHREALLLFLEFFLVVPRAAGAGKFDLVVSLLLKPLLPLLEVGVGLVEALLVAGLLLGHLALGSLQVLPLRGLVLLDLLGLLLMPAQFLLARGELCLSLRQQLLASIQVLADLLQVILNALGVREDLLLGGSQLLVLGSGLCLKSFSRGLELCHGLLHLTNHAGAGFLGEAFRLLTLRPGRLVLQAAALHRLAEESPSLAELRAVVGCRNPNTEG